VKVVNYYRCTIAYDGTDYFGWQFQPDRITVVQTLQQTFHKVFHCDASIVGASRTDAGVHALGQVAVCRTELDIDVRHIMWAWNNRLPHDIMIRSCERVDDNFHPQRNVLQKTYRYYFCCERPLPQVSRYRWYVRKKPDMLKLQKCLDIFVGTHDFRSFCTGDDMGTDTVRTINSITLNYIEYESVFCIEVCGASFLRYMIRRIVGASLIVAASHHLQVDYIRQVLHACNPLQKLPTAPAQGLVLQSIVYK
jgi:tRNA pseudouridine38-40 synthase